MKKGILTLVLIILLITILIITKQTDQPTEYNYQKITVEEMYEIMDNGKIIDVRTVEEYQEGYVKYSINIPLDDIDTIENTVKDKGTQLFIYCHSGVRSKEAAEILLEKGYVNVYDIGGIINMNIDLVGE